MAFFNTGEWQAIEERLDELDEELVQYNPARDCIFNSLRAVPAHEVRVCIVGQDPYPTYVHATGIAFSIPPTIKQWPPTLVNLFKEYSSDLHYPTPKNGDLTKWVNQGVLLWNVFPTCATGAPGSHHWPEYTYLTKEILEKLNGQNVVFVLLGGCARGYRHCCSTSYTIETSHPSPLGSRHGFLGSRIFTRVNDHLCKLGRKPINWRL